MSFDELLYRAKAGDMDAKAEIFAMYRPLLIKYSLVNRRFDEDLYQELAVGPGGVSCPAFDKDTVVTVCIYIYRRLCW